MVEEFDKTIGHTYRKSEESNFIVKGQYRAVKNVNERTSDTGGIHSRITDFLQQREIKHIPNRLKQFLNNIFSTHKEIEKADRRNLPCTEDISEQGKTRRIESGYVQYIPEIDPEEKPPEENEKIFWKRVSGVFQDRTRMIKAAAVLTVSLLFVWLISDTIFPYSSVGQKIHDALWPPSVYLNTIPRGASIFINGEDTGQKTPLRIAELTPGRYDITFKLDGFTHIEDVIDIPEKNESIVIKRTFSRTVTINSNPQNAFVIVNNRLTTERTPCELQWDVDQPFQLQLDLDGYPRIGDFEFDLLSGWSKVKDMRVWTFSTDISGVVSYRINGSFYKMVRFYSIPPKASVIIDGERDVVKETDKPILLTAGPHRVEMRPPASHAAFQPIRFDLFVDEATQDRISKEFVRPVSVRAVDASDSDVDADIVSFILLGSPENREIVAKDQRTPFQVELPYFDAKLVLGKAGYRETTIIIEKDMMELTVLMQKESGSEMRDRELADLFDEPATPVKQQLKSVDQQTVERKAVPASDRELQDLLEVEDKPSEPLSIESEKDSVEPQSVRSVEKVEMKIGVYDNVTWNPLEIVEIEARPADEDKPYQRVGATNSEGIITHRILVGTYDFRFTKTGWKPLIQPAHEVSMDIDLEMQVYMINNDP